MQGYEGLRKCCQCFNVWGVASKTPNFEPSIEVEWAKTPYAYALTGGQVNNVEAEPDNLVVGPTFVAQAAMVPQSYPYTWKDDEQHCERWPPTSSADASCCNDTFAVDITTAIDIVPDAEPSGTIRYRYVKRSRALWENGKQTQVTYMINPGLGDYGDQSHLNYTRGSDSVGDHMIVNIPGQFATEQLVERNFIGGTLINFYYQILKELDPDLNPSFANFAISGAGNQEYFGKQYHFKSSYHPGQTQWAVGRLNYEETVESGLRFWASDDLVGIKVEDNEEAPTGDYWIVLPSHHGYLITGTESVEEPDEPWVIAVYRDYDKLVTGKALNEDLRTVTASPPIGDPVVWDGTLQEAEVENVITDGEYTGIQVRSYLHRDGKDYVIFTSEGPGGEPEYDEGPLADFEDDNINSGLPEPLEFENGGSHSGNMWIESTTDPHGGTYCAESQISAVFAGVTNLSIRINVREDSDVTFWYKLDNRWYGTRVPPFVELTNFPDPDNHLTFYVDGARVPVDIDGTDYEDSRVDNVTIPEGNPNNDPAFYTTWRQVTISLTRGDHTIRWTLERNFQDNGHLRAYLDDIQFPEVMIGDDPGGNLIWFYDGEEVRRAQWWQWARRDEDDDTAFDARTAPRPDWITADHLGRVYYGNCHYLTRFTVDREHDTDFGKNGYIVWTASPAEPILQGPCDDPTLPPQSELIADPPWGFFKILPTKHTIQIRGANASLRDASDNIQQNIRKEYPDRRFVYRLKPNAPGDWTGRAAAWTISMDGKSIMPHIEIIWMPYFDLPAWPEPQPYDDPPYPTPFRRPRDPRYMPAPYNVGTEEEPEWIETIHWTESNFVVPRVYSDTYSHMPNWTWVHNVTPPEEFQPSPWPVAEWHCVKRFMSTIFEGSHTGSQFGGGNADSFDAFAIASSEAGLGDVTYDCAGEEEPPMPINTTLVSYQAPEVGSRNPDFDAVDCECGCG